jgi:hypothetical protein
MQGTEGNEGRCPGPLGRKSCVKMYNRTWEGGSPGPKANPEVDDEDIEAQNSEDVSSGRANGYSNAPSSGQGSEPQNASKQQTSKINSIADLHNLPEHSWPLRFEAIEDGEMRVSSLAGQA